MHRCKMAEATAQPGRMMPAYAEACECVDVFFLFVKLFNDQQSPCPSSSQHTAALTQTQNASIGMEPQKPGERQHERVVCGFLCKRVLQFRAAGRQLNTTRRHS